MPRRGYGKDRGEDPSNDWWPQFWKLRWSKYPDLPSRSRVLDFWCVNDCNDDGGHEVIPYELPEEGDPRDQSLPFGDGEFDAIVFHSSINKDPRVKAGMFGEVPPKKERSIIGGQRDMWAVKDIVRRRWSELYRVSKPNAVWFVSCYKHKVHNERVESEILKEEDRHGKAVRVEGW